MLDEHVLAFVVGLLAVQLDASDRPFTKLGVLASPRSAKVGARSMFIGEVVHLLARRDAGPAHDERHVDVLLERRHLPRREAVLTEMEAVVGAEDDVGVVELAGLLERVDDVLDEVLDAQHALELFPVHLVDGRDLLVVQQRPLLQPLRLRRSCPSR